MNAAQWLSVAGFFHGESTVTDTTQDTFAGGGTLVAPDTGTQAADEAKQAGTDQGTPTEGAEGEGQTSEAQAKPDEKVDVESERKKSRFTERVRQLNRDKRNLLRENSRLNEEIGRLRATKPPEEVDFDDSAAYHREAYKRAAKEAEAENRADRIRREAAETRERRQELWAERVEEAKSRFPDFEQVFNDDTPVTELMADIIVESDLGEAMAYYLGKNRGEARRIAGLPPVEQAREMGRLEARMNLPRTRSISSAPKPVDTVSGKSHQTAKPLAELDYESYRARRMEQIKRRQERA